MYHRIAYIFTALVLVVASLAACAPATPAAGGASASADVPALPAGAVFQVVRSDGSTQAFAAADIKKLPLASLTVEGKVEEGPKLLDILAQAGVKDFKQVTLTGSDGSLTMTKTQITDQTLLDLTNRGTVKLADSQIAKDKWIHDITVVKVD